jgi:hypothetical protein
MAYQETQRRVLDLALEALARETAATARVIQWEPHLQFDHRPDALIEIAGAQGTQQFAVDVKNTLDRFEILNHLRALWPHQARPPLLIVAPYITQQAAERCRNMELFFADTAGNAYVRVPGLHIYVTGKRKPVELHRAYEGRAITPGGLRIVFALLCRPQLLNETYRTIAATAQVALGAVGPVIKDLENRKHLTPVPDGHTIHRRFLDPERLFTEWVAAYPTVLRPKLNVRRFRAPHPNWTESVNLEDFHAFWGGEVAANRLLHHLQPQAFTIYIRDNPTRLIVDHRLRADVNGDTEVLDVFWNAQLIPGTRDVVPAPLAYADLFTTTEGRDLEAARMLYEEYIRPTFRNQP